METRIAKRIDTEISFPELRKTGISLIDEVPWGSHLSLFYENRRELYDVLTLYFKHGLENNEFCMWVVSPSDIEGVLGALHRNVPGFDRYLERGQIEVISYTEWYLREDGSLDLSRATNGWLWKMNQALARGYDGMRIAGDTVWLEKKDWNSFDEYECIVHGLIRQCRILAICTYDLSRCGVPEILNTCRNHQMAIILPNGQQDLLLGQSLSPSPCGHLNGLVVMGIPKLEKMYEDMNRLDRLNLIGKMAASIGHEIRNPLTTVRGFLQLLKSRCDGQELQESFDLMIEELDRANSIISEYLALAKDRPQNLRMQSLNEVIRNLLPMIQADALMTDKNIVVKTGNIPDILMDEKEIRQLILNLTRNGLEAMGRGGVLVIETFAEGQEVVLAVQDQGGGIDPGLLDKIYVPFFTTKENGTGLDLAICLNIARRHNAVIKIDTGPWGTTFRVRFNSAAGLHLLQ